MAKKGYGKVLGAGRAVGLPGANLEGPLDWTTLALELETRIVSHGGRPTNPDWDIQRLVPLNSKTWEQLKKAANRMNRRGRKFSPAQLASAILEKALAQLRS